MPFALHDWLAGVDAAVAVFVARDEATLRLLAQTMPIIAPERRVLPLPGWDNLPYDRSRPSRQATGQRVAALAGLADGSATPTLLLTTPESLLQRVPAPGRVSERAIPLAVGQNLDADWLHDTLLAFGYLFDDRVEEPGEAALHGNTMDAHLAGAAEPVRLELNEGRIVSIRWFDPATQRSRADTDRVLLLPTTEAFTVPGEDLPAPDGPARERLLPEGPLAILFDYIPDAAWAVSEGTAERCGSWLALVRDAYEVARIGSSTGQVPPPPERLYLQEEDITAALEARAPAVFAEPDSPGEPAVRLAHLGRRIADIQASGDAVILCADAPVATLRPVLARRLRTSPEQIVPLADWRDAATLKPRTVGLLPLPLPAGLHLPGRAALALRLAGTDRRDPDSLAALAAPLRLGDLVVEPARGLARLSGLVMEEQAGATTECLRLAFLGGTALLLPGTEANRIWRYGSSSTIKAHRLDSANWEERSAEVRREIDATAVALVARMQARDQLSAPVIEPGQAYRRFAGRRPYPLTRDQVRAIRAVQQDLASGRPMMRLVCGDVGFGKTEVALHAAALVAEAGRQVAVVAPTTLLARQHLDVFRRQLSGTGLRVEAVIRSSRSPENQAVLRDVSRGDVAILIGTHAIAAARFKDLGLIVIDEEQRFGEAQKRRLRALQDAAHALIMTGTPLPRSLQSALSGLIAVSVLSTPPSARQSGRSFVAPFDPALVRAALLREQRRGGQSFLVCPRVEDIAPMQAKLRDLVPELTLAVAHGRLRGEALDRVMLTFANGEADVLLSTSIIEAGLDLPNANTMLIWRADRLGLAQLHQLRGRVGRGRERATTYLLTDPDHPPGPAGRKRLEAVATLDALGAGFAISLADLDQRGAGDLLGDEQSGHVRLFGTDLYRDILEQALARARGEPAPDRWQPEIVLDLPAYVPEAFVPEPDERLGIYRQVARVVTPAEVDDAAEDLADRFGEPPVPAQALLDLARLRVACHTLGIGKVQAGPAAVALTPRGASEPDLLRLPGAHPSNGRVILPIAEASPQRRLQLLLSILADMGEQVRS